MIFNRKKGRASQDRNFKPIKVIFNKSASYRDVLSTCTKAVWPDKSNDQLASFYISDNTGTSIDFKIDDEVPWTLQNYIRISSKYPSKTRIYSVLQEGYY